MPGQVEDRKDGAAPDIEEMSIEDFRRGLADVVGHANYAGRRIVLTKHGKPVAGLVPIRDLDRLREIDATSAAVA